MDQKNITNFSQVWNEFIYSMRSEDKISDRLGFFSSRIHSCHHCHVVQFSDHRCHLTFPICAVTQR